MSGKTSKTSMKYLIVARLEVNGRVDEHDIIGAIFGQTESLLGEEFDLEKLQNKGKVGRVHVDIKRQGAKTVGKITIPSNLDRIETVILASMLETVDRIGPYDAHIVVEEIKDLREEKIKYIINRAKELLQLLKAQEPELKDLIREIAGTEAPTKPRKIKVIEYGPEKLPAAPGVDKADTIIIVEGRADVINLMKYGYDNVIALGGAREKVPKTIIDLAKKKKAIALVDGDRGGELILKTLLSEADIDYVARAPPGMEVEHLTGREIGEALARMEPADEVRKKLGLIKEEVKPAPETVAAEKPEAEAPPKVEAAVAEKVEEKPVVKEVKPEKPPAKPEVEEIKPAAEIPKKVLDIINELRGTLEAIFFDAEWNEMKRVKVRDLWDEIKKLEPGTVHAIVFDGIITPRIMDAAREKGVKILIGSRVGSKITSKPDGLIYLTFSDLV